MTIRVSDLKSQKIFSYLNEEELQHLCDSGLVQNYNKGEFLIREGSLNHFLFFIAKGTVHIKSYGVRVAKLSSGSLIGEVSVTGLGSPIADVIATGPVSTFKFSIEIINKIAAKNKTFATYLHDKAMATVLR